MRKAEKLLQDLASDGRATTVISSIPNYVDNAPEWLEINADVWNVAPLHRSAKTKTWNIAFDAITHDDIRELARVYALWQIVDRKLGPASIHAAWEIFRTISQALGGRSVKTLKTEDFYASEALLDERYNEGGSARACSTLAAVGRWLSSHVGMRIDYSFKRRPKARHGRSATDEEREAKLIPDKIVASLLAAHTRSDLIDRDRFFLSVIGIEVGTGFRVNELMTLPHDCLIDDAGALLVRNFTSKGGKSAPRVVPEELAGIVRDAVAYIKDFTEPARVRAREIDENPPLDWQLILSSGDISVTEYFTRRWLSNWIAKPFNRLIDHRYAFFTPRGKSSRWLPIMDFVEKHDRNVSAMSRELGIKRETIDLLIEQVETSQNGEVFLGGKTKHSRRGLDTDVRFPSLEAFAAMVGRTAIGLKQQRFVRELLDEACNSMLLQSAFFCPEIDRELEGQFKLQTAVLRDPETGSAILKLHDALLVVFRNQLSPHHGTDTDKVATVSSQSFNHWLSGYERDRGTGKPGDAVCSRLGIIDPRTGATAKITTHDFRHWLNTSYENGGLSQVQIATLFNRTSTSANSIYSQTSAKTRHQRLKNSMAEGLLIGHVAEVYSRIADETPDEAADFLESATRFYNPMPHGICRMNWALEPCPHALSCFACPSEGESVPTPCEHLIVDPQDKDQLDEIERKPTPRAVFLS